MRPTLRCLDVGPAASVQDDGRPGFAHLGLSASGAMDPCALHLANLLVGNPAGAAALELGLTGGRFRLEAAAQVRLALVGAAMPMTVQGRPLARERSHLLAAGEVLEIGAARQGVWAYLAIAGGLAVPEVLGSRSTHRRARLGGLAGRPLAAGDALPLALEEPAGGVALALAQPLAVAAGPIRIVLGPQDEHFTTAALDLLQGASFTVSAEADRMGYRLRGPQLGHRAGFNIVSDGILPGSIQVPGDGQPIVMMRDHQTTGGYPKIATVISADLPRLAQHRAGEVVRFMKVDLEAAGAARRGLKAAEEQAAQSIGPTAAEGGLRSERLLGLNLIGGVIAAGRERGT